jgi:hypothetical protein
MCAEAGLAREPLASAVRRGASAGRQGRASAGTAPPAPVESAAMTLEEIVISIVRIVGSLFVFKWAFVGGVIAILVDLSDLFMMNLLDLGGVRDYQTLDKWLDQVYMAAFLIVAVTKWRGAARNVAVILYVYRFIGFIMLEVTGWRPGLLFFPNVFEYWFIFVASLPHWRPGLRFNARTVAISLAILTPIKVAHEFIIHWAQLLDAFTAVEAVEWIWDFLTAPFR